MLLGERERMAEKSRETQDYSTKDTAQRAVKTYTCCHASYPFGRI
jgi:hypothetical protein